MEGERTPNAQFTWEEVSLTFDPVGGAPFSGLTLCGSAGPAGRHHPSDAAPDLREAQRERHRVLRQGFSAGDLQRGAVRPAEPHRGRQRAPAAVRRPPQQGGSF